MTSPEIEKIMSKYGKKLDSNYGSNNSSMIENVNTTNTTGFGDNGISREFMQFKQDMMPQLTRYEKWCNTIGNIIKLKLAEKDFVRIQKELDSAHIDTTPSQVVSLALLSCFVLFIAGLMMTVAMYFFTEKFSFLLLFLFLLSSAFLFYYFYGMPRRISNKWRLKASSQMVPCILYTVIYMKHTSNLERAINFASQHLDPPLALDFKKVFWDVEIGRFSTIKESLDNYLENWRIDSPEFVESFNLIESSLFEPSEERRVQILERALQVMLDGVYDKMLKFSRAVRSPLTNIYMLGIVLPTLGLALIPLASALLSGMIRWYHVFILFDVIVPFFVFYMTNEIMLKRPSGYGETSLIEMNPLYPKYTSKKPYLKASFISIPLFIIGLIPFIIHYTNIASLFNMNKDYTFAELGLTSLGNMKLFDFIKGSGPMGPLSLIFSLFIPLSIILFFYISYSARTKEIIKSRDYSKTLENEFNNSLFQLGNRIGDGMPAELAFGRVTENVRGQITEDFFKTVNSNIQSMGMSVERAIFDKKRGAIINYPSNLISTSMHILVESVKKGLRVAAQSLMSISDYVKNINKINERLRDLLAEVVSDMKSNMTFLAPLLAGIVVGLASMITLILSKLSLIINEATLAGGEGVSGFGTIGNIVNIFKVETIIPPYFLQICIGLYIIEIIFILTKALVTVDAGEDKLKETYDIGRYIKSAGLLYLMVAVISVIVLSLIAGIALMNLTV